MKKAFIVIMALLVLSMLFTACASDTTPELDEPTLEEQYDQAVEESVGDEELIGDEEYVEIGEMI